MPHFLVWFGQTDSTWDLTCSYGWPPFYLPQNRIWRPWVWHNGGPDSPATPNPACYCCLHLKVARCSTTPLKFLLSAV